jgi:hypothetical protein
MKELLGQILEIEDVQAISLMSFAGEVIFQEDSTVFTKEAEKSGSWTRLFEAMQGIREADLVFEKMRLYIRRTDLGYLVIVMGLFAPAPMVRMNCDMLLPFLRQKGKSKGLRSFFRKKA